MISIWYNSMCIHTGSAADICKAAMLKVMETLTQFTSQAKYQPYYYAYNRSGILACVQIITSDSR